MSVNALLAACHSMEKKMGRIHTINSGFFWREGGDMEGRGRGKQALVYSLSCDSPGRQKGQMLIPHIKWSSFLLDL